MTYWRMQLHPASSGDAISHTVQSLAAGYIGLDFAEDVGDLLSVEQASLPANQRYYWALREMEEGDLVLVVAHHFPFALAKIVGPYNYIRSSDPGLGIWFRHFRRVAEVRYYGDFITNAHDWQVAKMTNTIQPLYASDGIAYRLIEEWSRRPS